MKIAWIGYGVMGKPMATHLSRDHQITLYSRSQHKILNVPTNISVVSTLEAAIQHQDMIMTMLGTPDDVEQVYATILKTVKPGTILIDFTTSSPSLAKTLYLKFKKQSVSILDAPVTGGLKGAQEQNLTIMVGGDPSTFEKSKTILDTLGKRVLYVGEAGQGQFAKLANQIAIAGQLSGLAEALAFAQSKHLSLSQVISILSSGAAQSYSVTAYGEKMIQKDWQATFYLKHFLKDLRIAIRHATTPVPIAIAVEKMLSSLVKDYGEKGVQSLIQAYLK
ncbi:MAG: 2-hydroxy-3-oxopropionate reductase [Bacillota bacterium]|jgi:3-hydroxyisobutyrate dehydrogenase-like beta-hydroxyacid dehydrogenase